MSSNCSGIHREWYPPSTDSKGPQLVLYNSLVDEKKPFVPAAGPDSKHVTWYICGPTVYDSSHMGHARNYVTFDILRRVLEDYFGYSIFYVMNVTDVDDKIILRARRNHLLKEYQEQNKDASQVRAYAAAAISAAHEKQQQKVAEAQEQVDKAGQPGNPSCSQTQRNELESALKNEQHKLGRIMEAAAALAGLPAQASVEQVLGVASDYVAEALDKEKGQGVTDLTIFRAHAAKYEREFFEDMTALGCRPPSVLTRVGEYIPEIIAYVEKIISNGMAYEANGSVYFDTKAYKDAGHTYAKLKPWAVGSAMLASEGESNFTTSEKRNPSDFALWKNSKAGEPRWDSPWGQGRPGWHIECSAMASALLGCVMDLHSGGEDLRFPHHDNELAQAEAHYHHEGCRQWVNYFLHSGHLEIEGLKMSKSLKNFITIRQALETFSARQLRLMFVLQPWNKNMVYGEQTKSEVLAKEKSLNNFFQNVEVAVREAGDHVDMKTRWEAPELELHAALRAAQDGVHKALCDNINTSAALDCLFDIVKAANKYMAGQQAAKPEALPCQPLLLKECTAYVTRILSVMGIVDGPSDKPGLNTAGGSGSSDADARITAYLDAFSAFRDEVRKLAASLDKAGKEPMMAACDRVRDEVLVALGVRLEDRPDMKAVWKLDDPKVLREEMTARAAAQADAKRRKAESKLNIKVSEYDKLSGIAAMAPIEDALSEKYAKGWGSADPNGVPTHDHEGKPLDDKAKKKAAKDVASARKAREPLAKKLAEDPEYMAKLAAEVEQLRQELAALGVSNGQA